jgi:hypothetical protein
MTVNPMVREEELAVCMRVKFASVQQQRLVSVPPSELGNIVRSVELICGLPSGGISTTSFRVFD